MSSEHVMSRLEWCLLLILALFWGASFFFYKVLVAELPPLTIVLGREGISALVMNLLLWWRGGRLPTKAAEWRDHFILAVLNNALPFALTAYSETRISSVLASILNATTPIFTVLVAHALTHNEKLSWNKLVGVVIGFAGVIVLIDPAALKDISGTNMLGEIACLAAAVSYSFANVFGRRFRGHSLLQVATTQVTASFAITLPAALFVDHPWNLAMPSLPAWAALAGLALLSTVIAYTIFFYLLAKTGATNVSLVTFLVPISAVVLGVALLGETMNLKTVAGMLVIGLGLAAIDGRPLAWVRRHAL